MTETDAMMDSFRGPTPPPAVDQKVMQAADKAASRLSAEAKKSYSEKSNTTKSTEQTTMSDNIVFPCPACGTKYSVSPHHAGKKTTCKKCNAQVTVPTPQVANPTLVGGTRTIRRADIDPGHSSREEAIDGKADVDMTGGASVMRKEETVIGAPPMTNATHHGARTTARRPTAGAARPAPAPAGRPMPYGKPGAAGKKKNNTPMLLGIGGGVLGLVLLIVVIVIASGDPAATPGANTASGDGGGKTATVDPEQKLIADHNKQYNNVNALSLSQVREHYDQANERKDKAEWKAMRDKWAPELARKAESGGTPEELAAVALLLDDAKYREAGPLLEQAWKSLKTAGKATSERTIKDRKVLVPNPKFVDIVTRLGWKPYKRPAEMDDCYRLEVTGAREYTRAYQDIDQTFHDVELYPPELVEDLTRLEKEAMDGYNALKEEDKDGWAIKSRQAWIRFKLSQDSKAKVDRTKGKRSFSPLAMEREGEPFDSVWTYTYGPSFMVFVEKPIGESELDEDFLETLESKKALLSHLYDWFREHLIDEYNLQRVKPKDNAALAQKEGWPMEIVVLKDRATFEKYASDVLGQPMPGARAFYSPLDERVMTYDDRTDMSADTQWFNESVIIHETFHMLSDFYAANPMFTMDEIQVRPRYSSILVQEGLTDSVSGFTRGGGEGRKATYEFLQLNHLRLSDFKAVYEILGKKELYRIRDTLECRHYGQCTQKAFERMATEKFKVNPLWLNQVAVGVYYATACQISYFFENYKDGSKYPYRDKWWEYIGLDYQGKMNLKGYDDNSAVTKFKDVFGIKSDKDWDDMEKKFLEFTLELEAEDVGKGGADLKGDDAKKEGDDTVNPGIPPMPGFGQDGSQMPALPGREREEEAALVG
jgi:hypothetical protein